MDDVNQATDKIPDKRVFFVIGVFFGILVLLSVSFFLLTSLQGKNSPTPTGLFTDRQNGDNGTPNPSQPTPSPTFPPPPKFVTSQWTMSPRTQPLDILASQKYFFKQNYSVQDARTFAQGIFKPQIFKATKSQLLAYTLDPVTKDTEALRFSLQSGTFSFLTTKGISLATQSGSISNDSIYTFLRTINLYDPSLLVTAQYQKTDNSDVTYIELHRDWRRLGLPDLNFVGLMNLPESQNLAALTLDSSSGTLIDPTIINTTDGKNGLERQRDFNTMTIAIDTTHKKIIGIESNIRRLDTTKTQTRNLLTYADAETKLKNNGYELIFSTPSGNGSVPWNKVYPGNIADARDAVVTDALYTYLELPPTVAQSELKPYILFRGYATLKNGYRSNFVAAVSADQSAVLGASTTATESRLLAQQQEVNLNQPTANPTYVVPLPTIPPPCLTGNENDQPAPFDQAISFMEITLVHTPYTDRKDDVGKPRWRDDNDGKGHWYYLPKNDTLASLQADLTLIAHNIDAFVKLIGAAGYKDFRVRFYLKDKATGEETYNPDGFWGGVLGDFKGTTCPLRLTGGSPSIFIYGKPGQSLKITSGAMLTYADPGVHNLTWDVTVGSNNSLLVNDTQRNYIYYEYVPVSFNKPPAGWIIKKNDLHSLTQKISSQLGLNTRENERLIFELANAATPIASDSLFVGIVDMNEVNQKVPLTISPQPEKVYRFHFYVGSAKGTEKITAPALKPLERTTYMLLELGSYQGK